MRRNDRAPAARRRRRRRRRRPPLFLAAAVLLAAVLAVWFLLEHQESQAVKPPPENPDWIRQDLLPRNPYSRPGDLLEQVEGIVVHYVGNPGTTAAQNHSYFANLAQTGETYASSHFLIGLEGEIIQNVPLDEIAYCSNSRNSDTISIECCHPDEEGRFTQATYDALVKLTRWLMEYYELSPDQVIRHYDVTKKECPLYYVRNPQAWEDFLAELGQEEPS